MVHLEEVEDQDLVRQQPGPYEEDDDEADYTDTGKYPVLLLPNLTSLPPSPLSILSPSKPQKQTQLANRLPS